MRRKWEDGMDQILMTLSLFEKAKNSISRCPSTIISKLGERTTVLNHLAPGPTWRPISTYNNTAELKLLNYIYSLFFKDLLV